MGAVFRIAFRNLFGELGRLAISVGGVAFSVMLILVLLGLYAGWQAQMIRYLESVPADLWIGQTGSGDLAHSISILPIGDQSALEEIEGIDRVIPFSGRRGGVEIGDSEAGLYLIGIEPDGFVRPYQVIEGKEIPGNGEIIVDEALAIDQGLEVGDEVELYDRTFRIVGISSGGNLLVFTYAFISLEDLNEVAEFEQFTNYFLVQTNNPSAVKDRIEVQFPDLAVFEKSEILDRNAAIIRETFLPVIWVLVVIAIAIGTAVIGLTIFTATIEKSREFGVLKAMGYTNGQLFLVATIQSVASGAIGFGIGNVLAPIIAILGAFYAGGFVYETHVLQILLVGGMTFMMVIIAVFLPLRRIISIDPAAVFKA